MGKLNKLLLALEELSAFIEGAIEGHSWGQGFTGTSKIDISDLEEIKTKIDIIIDKFKKDYEN